MDEESAYYMAKLFPNLSSDAHEVLFEIGLRMMDGQEIYGALDLATDGRDFDREALEEDLDGLVYRACKIIQERKYR